MSKSITELAKMFKERENIIPLGVMIGVVESPFPDIKIRIDNKILLDKKMLIFGKSILKGYEREIEIPSTSVTGADSKGDGHISMGIPKGKIIYKDSVKVGDSVIVVPTVDNQTYFVIDWGVRVK